MSYSLTPPALMALGFAFCASLGTHLLCAQSTPEASTAAAVGTVTVTARIVVLDVVVTDQAGKPVDGLTAKDFRVLEDGKPQRIRSLEPPSVHTLPPTSLTEGKSAAFDPAQPASFGRSPVDILVLDQLNTHFADSSFARRSLHDYLASRPAVLPHPTSLLSLDDTGFKQLQASSRDRDSLLRALAAVPSKYAWKLEVKGKTDHGPIERLDLSLRALEEMAQTYARVPGRKNLIWIGGGFPSIDPASLDSDDLKEVKDTLQHVTNVLLDSHVTLYAIDPTSTAPGMTEITDGSQMAFIQAGGDASGSADPFGGSEDFDKLAPLTGGRVVRGMNDIGQQIASSVDRGADFYTISYTPSSSSESAAQFRNIRVICIPAGLTASTRGGYYSGHTQQEKSAATAAYDLTTAAEGAMPLNGLRVTVDPDTSDGALPESYLIHVGVSALTWKPNADGSATSSVYVMAVSLNAKSKMLNHVVHGMKAEAKAGTDLRDGGRAADFRIAAAPAPKSTALRFIVRDSATGRMGSVDLPLTKR